MLEWQRGLRRILTGQSVWRTFAAISRIRVLHRGANLCGGDALPGLGSVSVTGASGRLGRVTIP